MPDPETPEVDPNEDAPARMLTYGCIGIFLTGDNGPEAPERVTANPGNPVKVGCDEDSAPWWRGWRGNDTVALTPGVEEFPPVKAEFFDMRVFSPGCLLKTRLLTGARGLAACNPERPPRPECPLGFRGQSGELYNREEVRVY